MGGEDDQGGASHAGYHTGLPLSNSPYDKSFPERQ
jgi:hypothetical protein